ncbi:MAG: anti-sigma factor [Candidatus Eremiobacteraeota bacterium]|nr:anti-sigma factor [Candidatus Eremiobacteraeota bacterium]
MNDATHVTDLAAGYALGALSEHERGLVDAHIGSCADCRADVMALLGVAGTLPLACDETAPPGELKTRILDAAAADSRASQALWRRSAQTAAAQSALAPPPVWQWVATAAAAAALVLGVVALDQSRQRAALQTRADALAAQVGELQRTQLALRSDADAGHAIVTAFASGTYWTAGPHADASGNMWRCAIVQPPARGHNAMLLASVPTPPRGMAYQVWVGRKGEMRKAGMLTHGGMAMLDMPMPLRKGDVVAFSVEPPAGSPAPTSPYAMEIVL